MKMYIVHRDGKKSLRFNGDMIGFAEDEHAILILYKTSGGQYVSEKIGLAGAKRKEERHSGSACKTRQDIISFFGRSQLSAELFKTASLDSLPAGDDFENVE